MNNFQIGQKASLSKMFRSEDVIAFSKLSLDNNPIHLDDNYAASTSFKRRIVHGFLYSSLLSAVIGTKLPGNGSVYMEQNIKFLKPVYLEETVTAEVEIVNIDPEKSIIALDTNCYKATGELVIKGTAKIKFLKL